MIYMIPSTINESFDEVEGELVIVGGCESGKDLFLFAFSHG